MSDPTRAAGRSWSHDDLLFRLLVEGAEDHAMVVLDPQGRVASWNAGARRIHGYRADEILGRHLSVFYLPEARREGAPERALRAAEEGEITEEGWRVRADGTRFWGESALRALHGADGELLGFAALTRDRSEWRQTQEAVLRREARMAQVHKLARLGSWEWEVGADRIHGSDELLHLLGVSRDFFASGFSAYLALVHPEDRERVRAGVERAVREGGSFDLEERIVRPDGEIRHLRSRGEVLVDGEGRAVRVVGACQDVTAEREAERRTRALERARLEREVAEAAAARLELLAGASEALAESLDFQRTLVVAARLAVPRLADWCAVDLLGEDGELCRVAVEHRDPATRALGEELRRDYAPLRESGAVWRAIRTGQAQQVEIAPGALESAARDRRHRELLAALGIRSALVVPLVARGQTLGALTLANAGSGRVLDRDDRKLALDLARRAAVAIDNARLVAGLEAHGRELEEQAMELELQTEELQCQAAQLEEALAELEATNQELQRQSTALQEMTAELEAANAGLRRANEALATRTVEAEAANRAKGEFLAVMSHELRTPLNAIFGYADLLELGVHGPLNDAQTDALERIKRNQGYLLSLINDVLNFARVEAGRVDFRMADLPLEETLRGLDALIEPQLRARGLEYHHEPCDPEVRVRGDRERVEQVLLNLLTNAIKFTDPGGEIAVAAEWDEARVSVRVSDTGCGIPAERLPAIFDPFVQVHRHHNESSQQGVGLGLAISRELARAMGGDLAVESREGEGTTFTLTLPRGRREHEGNVFAQGAGEVPAAGGSTLRRPPGRLS